MCQYAYVLIHSFAKTSSDFVCLSKTMALKCVCQLAVKVMTCSSQFEEHQSQTFLIGYRKFLARSLAMLSNSNSHLLKLADGFETTIHSDQ